MCRQQPANRRVFERRYARQSVILDFAIRGFVRLVLGSWVFLRSKIAAIGAGFYLLAFVCAALYPVFDRRTFSGLVAVLLGWPWIDYIPSAWFPLAVVLNAITIYVLLAVLSLIPALLRRLRE
jgi:hypothetical protein